MGYRNRMCTVSLVAEDFPLKDAFRLNDWITHYFLSKVISFQLIGDRVLHMHNARKAVSRFSLGHSTAATLTHKPTEQKIRQAHKF